MKTGSDGTIANQSPNRMVLTIFIRSLQYQRLHCLGSNRNSSQQTLWPYRIPRSGGNSLDIPGSYKTLPHLLKARLVLYKDYDVLQNKQTNNQK